MVTFTWKRQEGRNAFGKQEEVRTHEDYEVLVWRMERLS